MGGQEDPLPKICHIHHAIMKLDTVILHLKLAQKVYKSRNTFSSSANISIYSPETPEINIFAISGNADKVCILIHKF